MKSILLIAGIVQNRLKPFKTSHKSCKMHRKPSIKRLKYHTGNIVPVGDSWSVTQGLNILVVLGCFVLCR